MWVLASRLAGPSAREDVYQEALMRAWTRWDTFDPDRGSPRAWLLMLVHDRCRRYWRGVQPVTELVDPPAAVIDVAAQVDLSRAVATLSPRQRLVVELFYVLDLPVTECAVVMGCTTGTVSSTLSDARRSLRRLLEVSL
jgi:RNA polymerase sigma-70 factor (ECF subfamily)